MLPNTSVTRKDTDEGKSGLFSRFSKSESAAATAILAILLLGLVFTIISVVRLEYVPEWKNDAEQDHTYEIWDNMMGVKLRIDMLSGLMESGNYSTNSFSSTVPFNIGGGEIPIFASSKSNGRLEINTERCRMTIKPHIVNQTINPYFLECGGISCFSVNNQYPDQVFRYENGALILADGKSSIMKQSPVLAIEENKTNKSNYTVAIRSVKLLGKPNSVSSNTIIPLRLTGREATPKYDSNNTSIESLSMTIATKYPEAWFVYLNETAQEKGLDYGNDYSIKLDSNSVRFSFLSNENKTLERFYISEVIINAEIIPLRYQNVMKLNQWYSFDTSSDTTIDLYRLRDYGAPVNFSIQDTTGKDLGKTYSESSYVLTDILDNDNSFESIFGFNGFTEFDSEPSSVTILMIYQFPKLDPLPNMTLRGETLPQLVDNNKNNWYLYQQTINNISISDPSDLEFNLKIGAQNGNKKINIDYLAVYLS